MTPPGTNRVAKYFGTDRVKYINIMNRSVNILKEGNKIFFYHV